LSAPSQPARADASFLPRIQSIRGLAALAVALHHGLIWLVIGGHHEIWNTPIGRTGGGAAGIVRLLLSVCNGSAAVTVFFVLSGFVLALSLQKAPLDLPACAAFWVRRFFRIYPAYVFSLVLIYAYLRTLHPGFRVFAAASDWFNWWFVNPVSLSDLPANFTMQTLDLNQVAWTLRIELIFSLLFPALYLVSRRGQPLANVTTGALWTGLLLLPASNPLHFGLMFFLGINVCVHGRRLVEGLEASRLTPFALVLVALLFWIPGLFSVAHSGRNDFLESAAAAGLVALCAYGHRGGPFRVLDLSAIRFLGKISYSFYLLNFIVLYVLAYQVLARVDPAVAGAHPLPLLLATGIAAATLTLPIAALCWYCIEKPSVRLGRVLADAINGLRRPTALQSGRD
jgi:peptidoglycan/LPS O-acetylase OafA/YrhL